MTASFKKPNSPSPVSETETGFLTFGNHALKYRKMGNGKELIVAFHGFSQDGSIFQELAVKIKERFTIIGIDFPGPSSQLWADQQPPDYPEMSYFIHKICEYYHVANLGLMGFSMGGRVALSLIPYLPQKINHLYLLAPDGMKRNIWYYLATKNIIGRALLKKMMNHPDQWVKSLYWLADFKIIKKGWRKITQNTLNNPDLRKQTLIAWPFTRNFIPNPTSVKRCLNKNKIPLDLFMGEMDSVFPVAEGKKFLKGIHKANLHILQSGHHLLKKENVEGVAAILLKQP